MLQCAKNVFRNQKAADYAEPFPPFLLKAREMRSRAGILDGIAETKALGKSVKEAKKVDNDNKDITLGL